MLVFALCGVSALGDAPPATRTAAAAPDSAPVDSLRLAQQLVGDRNYTAAVPLLQRILPRTEQESGASSREAGAVLDLLVMSLWQGGRSQEPETIALARRAVAVKQQVYGAEDLETATSLFSVGVISAMNGDLAGADSVFAGVLRIREARLPADHASIVSSINALANMRYVRGDHGAALPLYRRALAIVEAKSGPSDPQTFSVRGNLANSLIRLGAYAEARRLLDHQIELLEAAGLRTEDLAYAHSLLATMSQALGDFEEDLELTRKALEIRAEIHPPGHPRIAESQLNVGNAYLKSGRLAEARDTILSARNLWEQTYGPDHVHLSNFDEALGIIAIGQHDWPEARRRLERALQVRERGLGPDTPEVGELRQFLGRVALAQGEVAEARDAFRRATEIILAGLGPRHPVTAECRYDLARAELRAGNSAAAVEGALQAEEVFHAHLRLTLKSLPERQALRYCGQSPPALDLVLSAAVESEDPDLVSRAWNALIRSRGMVQDEMATRARRSATLADSGGSACLSACRQAGGDLANLVVRGPQGAQPQIYRQLVDDARQRLEAAERALASADVVHARAWSDEAIGWPEVLRARPPGSAVVAYQVYRRHRTDAQPDHAGSPEVDEPSRYCALVLPAEARQPAIVDLGDASGIDNLISGWRGENSREATAGPAQTQGESSEGEAAGRLVRRILWDPVAVHVAGAERVFVVPAGQIHLVNLTALPDEAGGYLIESAPLLYYLSAERELAAPPAIAPVPSRVLVLGAPDFDRRARAASGAGRLFDAHPRGWAQPLVTGLRGSHSGCRELQDLRFSPLPASLAESKEVAAFWRSHIADAAAQGDRAAADPVLLLTGREAEESAFKRLAPGRHVLHLATHGFFVRTDCASESGKAAPGIDQNPLLYCGLALAGANRRDGAGPGEEDGILTAQEIATLDLSEARWAVLSACETGSGRVLNGEGVLGLQRAMRIAGVRTLVTSLWGVEDEAARSWMNAFYRAGLEQGLDAAEAVRAASRAVLEERRRRGQSTLPFFWGAFVATGTDEHRGG